MYVCIPTIRVQASLLGEHEIASHKHTYIHNHMYVCIHTNRRAGELAGSFEHEITSHIHTYTYLTICMYAFFPSGAQESLLGVSSMRLPSSDRQGSVPCWKNATSVFMYVCMYLCVYVCIHAQRTYSKHRAHHTHMLHARTHHHNLSLHTYM